MKKRLSLLAALLLIVVALVAAAPAAAKAYPDLIPLPNGFRPEGIVVGNGHTAYAGSLGSGDIYAVDLRTGAGETIIAGPGTPAVGLSFDARSGYLYVAGGSEGTARVYDPASGGLVAEYDFGGGFVNDAIVTGDAVYFTDSFIPALYRVDLGPAGALSGTSATLPLGGDFTPIPGFNTNGIEASANGDALIIVHSALGVLYRVDPDSGVAATIDLGGVSVASGDGLVRVGQTLYVVQNMLNQVAKFQLNSDLSAGTLLAVITADAFDIPTTADTHGSALYAVNARFGTPPGPDVTYDIVKVKR